jgi:hypothetical protein
MEEQMSIEAMKQALEALEGFIAITNDSQGVNGYHLNGDIAEWNEFDEVDKATEAITALRTAIEQAEKQVEPFGHFQYDVKLDAWVKSKTNNGVAFYTTPPTGQPQDLNGGHQLDVAGHASTATITKWSYRDCGSEGWFIAETVAAPGGLLPQQEPVAKKPCPACGGPLVECQHCEGEGYEPGTDNDVTGPALCRECGGLGGKRNTTPPAAQREWVGLTEPELHEINPTWPAPDKQWNYDDVLAFVRAIEAKLKEKNA